MIFICKLRDGGGQNWYLTVDSRVARLSKQEYDGICFELDPTDIAMRQERSALSLLCTGQVAHPMGGFLLQGT